ncbi:MAG: hypothetical protein V8R52_14000 [Coprobacter fastidiosus]
MHSNTVFSTDKEDICWPHSRMGNVLALLITVMIVTAICGTHLRPFPIQKQSEDKNPYVTEMLGITKTYLATPTPERTITFVNDCGRYG